MRHLCKSKNSHYELYGIKLERRFSTIGKDQPGLPLSNDKEIY